MSTIGVLLDPVTLSAVRGLDRRDQRPGFVSSPLSRFGS